jgi:outer membrane protein OmpA-like peptidoglycan-associated protein
MSQQAAIDETKEIRSKAYGLYKDHGFENGNEFIDWLEAEKQVEKQTRTARHKQIRNILLTVVLALCVIAILLLAMLLRASPQQNLSERLLSDLKVVLLVLDPKSDGNVAVFDDTHFGFGESAITEEAKKLLNDNIRILKENPDTNVRMAGYTSAAGSEETNQELSEARANSVRDYLVEEGIAPNRITVIGYGRTRPAFYEARPHDTSSKEALANMRVLFEVIVK